MIIALENLLGFLISFGIFIKYFSFHVADKQVQLTFFIFPINMLILLNILFYITVENHLSRHGL